MRIPFYKKLASYIYPIVLEHMEGIHHRNLSILLYQGQLMMSTTDAIYSYGTKYYPFGKPFAEMKKELPRLKSFLLLGTGLGSALKILQADYKLFPKTVLVDYDEAILALSVKYMGLNAKQNVQWVCDDASGYLHDSQEKFDLIGVDVFKGMFVPTSVRTDQFILDCTSALNPNGICIWNMMFHKDIEEQDYEQRLQTRFTSVVRMNYKVNTFFICRL